MAAYWWFYAEVVAAAAAFVEEMGSGSFALTISSRTSMEAAAVEGELRLSGFSCSCQVPSSTNFGSLTAAAMAAEAEEVVAFAGAAS